jgi:hypothetical protein
MSSVHHPPSSSHSSVGCFSSLNFSAHWGRLTDPSVSLTLHACLCGTPVGFHVSNLKIAITVFWWHPSKWTLPLLTSSASPHLTLMSTSTSGGGYRKKRRKPPGWRSRDAAVHLPWRKFLLPKNWYKTPRSKSQVPPNSLINSSLDLSTFLWKIVPALPQLKSMLLDQIQIPKTLCNTLCYENPDQLL